MQTWRIEINEAGTFEKFVRSLTSYEQAVVAASIEHVLKVLGIEISATEWGTPIGHGLVEFRVRKSLTSLLHSAGSGHAPSQRGERQVLLRIFCAFHGDRVVILHHGYNKGKDPSKRRQAREIAAARRIHAEWKRSTRT